MSDILPPTTPSRAQVPPAELPGLSGLLTLAVSVVVVAALYLAREVMIPITLAVLLSFVLAPLVGLLRWLRVGRVPSVILAVVLALGVILGLGSLIGTQVAQIAGNLPLYQTTITRKVGLVRGFVATHLNGAVGDLGKQIENSGKAAAPEAASPAPAARPEPQEPKPTRVEVIQPPPSPLELARRVLSPVVGPLGTAFIVFVVTVFVLLQMEDLRDRLIRLFGSRDLHRTTAAMDDAAARLSRYFLTQLGINASFGVVIGIGLAVIGVPSPVLWGVLSALLRFVPYIGSFLAGVMPVALAAAVSPGWSMMVEAAALYLVIEPVLGQVVEPLLYGHSTGLSPAAVVIAAIFWTWLWGPIGLILSTPLTLCLVVLGRHVDRLEFLDVVLGDRPALTPAENFYQRMLAGDADEAGAMAEALLRERPLSSYYDEVALKGLQLAAHDARRGALTPELILKIREAADELIDNLSDHDDTDPAPEKGGKAVVALSNAERSLPKGPAPEGPAPVPDDRAPAWRGPAPVLCIAGRGPLDDAAAGMLAQLLEKHGLGARTVPHEAVSRAKIGTMDVSGVAMVCVSYLEIAGNPVHLRYVLRRLRLRLPGVPILVGLWPEDSPALHDPHLRASIGADITVSSLREAVNACLERSRVQEPERKAVAPVA